MGSVSRPQAAPVGDGEAAAYETGASGAINVPATRSPRDVRAARDARDVRRRTRERLTVRR
ncbi:hypothetical protein GCM10010433_13860 [Streptomyces pulveraceus]